MTVTVPSVTSESELASLCMHIGVEMNIVDMQCRRVHDGELMYDRHSQKNVGFLGIVVEDVLWERKKKNTTTRTARISNQTQTTLSV